MTLQEKVIKGLECCFEKGCNECPYKNECDLEVSGAPFDMDTLFVVRQLKDERDEAYEEIDLLNAQVVALEGAYETMERERDVLVRSLKRKFFGCEFCKHYLSKSGSLCDLPIEKRQPSFNCWEWCGIEKGDEKQ